MNSGKLKEVILARGHKNILATHETTIEITKDSYLSKRGNCIIAVEANKGLNDLSREFKEGLRKDEARITITIDVGGLSAVVNACGNSKLVLSHPADIVVRKSGYICNRTLAIHADKSTCDLPRELVERLKDPKQKVKIILAVKV